MTNESSMYYLQQDGVVIMFRRVTKSIGNILYAASHKSIRRENGNGLECIDAGEDFLNRTLMSQALISTINKWDLMKLKSFCNAKHRFSLIVPANTHSYKTAVIPIKSSGIKVML
ncbi:hypothetical protein STEG23_009471, partial [Scotinomys teguina]